MIQVGVRLLQAQPLLGQSGVAKQERQSTALCCTCLVRAEDCRVSGDKIHKCGIGIKHLELVLASHVLVRAQPTRSNQVLQLDEASAKGQIRCIRNRLQD